MTARPLLASLVAGLSPAVLLSANTIMTDVPMVLCYVWAVEFWLRGLDNGQSRDYIISGALIGFGALIKYFCITAIPLLALYTLVRNPKAFRALGYLFVPIFIVGIYVAYGIAAYGVNLLTSAADFAIEADRDAGGHSTFDRLLVGVIFLGGCLLPALFMFPALWRTTGIIVWTLIAGVGGALVLTRTGIAGFELFEDGHFHWNSAIHAAVFFIAGAHILGLGLVDLVRRRDAESVLLVCWLLGTFMFSALVNWTVNARTILPAAIPAAILVARQFDGVRPWRGKTESLAYAVPLALSVLAAAGVLWGDYRWSGTQRDAARYFGEQSRQYGREYLHKGHWGFQHYMEAEGLIPFDSLNARVGFGDRIVLPQNNYSRAPFNPRIALPVTGLGFEVPATWGISTMHRDAEAGWYTHIWGVLPFRFGRVPAELYWVYEIGDYRDLN